MISEKVTPKLRKRFLQEIKKTKEINKEIGFYMCLEDNGKLSAGNTCTGGECSLTFQNIREQCIGKKIQGDFHTHPYLADVKKMFGIRFKGASDKLIRSAIDSFLESKELSPTIPSQADLRSALLGRCSKRTEGTTCIGSDLVENNVECWTTKNIEDGDCVRALVEYISPKEEGNPTLPQEWIKPLFYKEIINLK